MVGRKDEGGKMIEGRTDEGGWKDGMKNGGRER